MKTTKSYLVTKNAPIKWPLGAKWAHRTLMLYTRQISSKRSIEITKKYSELLQGDIFFDEKNAPTSIKGFRAGRPLILFLNFKK